MIKHQGKGHIDIIMALYMKVNENMTKRMDLEFKHGPMGKNIKESIEMG